MQYCDKCHMKIAGSRKRCPLCQGRLSGTGDDAAEIFPLPEKKSPKYQFVMRCLLFSTLALVILSIAVNAMFPTGSWWSLFVAAAVACFWLCLSSILRRRANLSKNIIWMVFWISLLAVLWDLFTGWHSWSLDYVIPIVCVLAMAAMFALGRAMRLQIEEYMIYLILDGLFGIVPLLFLLLGWVEVTYASISCVAVSALSLCALFAFQGEQLISEIKKRLHL